MQPHEMPTLYPALSSVAEESRTSLPENCATTVSTLPKVAGFLIEGELGRGGMGIVYLARQLRLNRLVALKMILNADHSDADTRLRFLAEAEAIAKLHHPGIVQVHEFGTHENNPYFSLEYVNGGSLDCQLTGTPFTPHEAADLVEKLARAVQSAHEHGIIHRDLKPANILLAEKDSSGTSSHSHLSTLLASPKSCPWQPKITDFGLVKKEGSDMTATGAILGTPSYMAPEQADAKKSIGIGVDIYALGAILYECLTGRPPFKAATPIDTILQVIHQEPVSIRQLQPKTPLDLETICMKCLQKDPAKRYATSSALADDLLHYLRNEPISARPVGRVEKTWRWCRRYPMVAGLAASILLLVMSVAAASLFISYYVSTINSDLSQSNDQLLAKQTALQKAEAEARQAEDAAKQQADAARRDREHARDLLCQQYEINAVRLMEEGDTGGALLWTAAAMKESGGNTERERAPRMRFTQLMRSQPRPMGVWQTNYNSYSKERPQTSADGRYLGINASSAIVIMDLDTDKQLPVPTIPKDKIVALLKLSTDARYAACIITNKTSEWRSVQPSTIPWAGDPLASLAQATCHALETLNQLNMLLVWDVATNRLVHPPVLTEVPQGKLVFSADNTRLLYGSIIVDLKTGKLLCHITTPQYVHDAVLSDDGKQLLLHSGYGQPEVQVWDTTTGQPIGSPCYFCDKVSEIAFNREGQPLAVVLNDSTNKDGDAVAEVWNISTGQRLAGPLDHQSNRRYWAAVRKAVLSPGRTRLLTETRDSTCVWEIASGKKLCSIDNPGRENYITQITSFTEDGNKVQIVNEKGFVGLWSIDSGKLLTSAFRQYAAVDHAALSPDGDKMVVGDHDGKATVWNLAANHAVEKNKNVLQDYTVRLHCKLHHDANVWWSSCVSTGRHVLTLSDSISGQTVCTLWNMTPELIEKRVSLEERNTNLTQAAFMQGAESALVVNNQNATMYRLQDSGFVRVLTAGKKLPGTLKTQYSMLGKYVAIYNNEYSPGKVELQLWNAVTGKLVASLLTMDNSIVKAVEFNQQQTRCTAVIHDEANKQLITYLWDTSTGKQVGAAEVLSFGTKPVQSGWWADFYAIFTHHGEQAWYFASDSEVVCRHAGTGSLLPSPGRIDGEPRHYDVLSGFLVTTKGKYGGQQTTLVWNTQQLKVPAWKGDFHSGKLAFNQSSNRIALATGERGRMTTEIRLRDAKTGKAISPAMTHEGEVKLICFGDQDRLLASITENDKRYYLHWWHAEKGMRISAPLEVNEEIYDIAFNQSGDQLLAITSRGSLVRWKIPLELWKTDDIAVYAQAVSGRSLDAVGGLVPLSFAERTSSLEKMRKNAPDLLLTSSEALKAWYLDKIETERESSKKTRYYDRLVAMTPHDTSVLFKRGTYLRASESYDASAADYTQIIATRPQDPHGWLGRGHTRYHGTQNYAGLKGLPGEAATSWDAAYPDLSHALTLPADFKDWSDFTCPCSNLVNATDAGMMRYQQAIKLLSRATRIAPQNTILQSLLGRAYLRVGDASSTVTIMTRLLSTDTSNVEDIAFLIMAYHRLGKAMEAESWVAQAKAIQAKAVFRMPTPFFDQAVNEVQQSKK